MTHPKARSIGTARLVCAAATICGALLTSPVHAEDTDQDADTSFKSVWVLIMEGACNTGVDSDQSVDVPANTAVTLSYNKIVPDASYVVVCYRRRGSNEWAFWSVSATEGGGNHGMVTFGPYNFPFQVLTNATLRAAHNRVSAMSRHKRNDTSTGVEFDYFATPDSASASMRIDLTMTPPPER